MPDEALDFTLVEYTSEDVQVLHGVEVDECRFHLGTPGHTWIDVAGRPSSDMLRDLGMAFNLHPLALEDVFHANQRSKLDLYEGQGFIVLNDPVYEDEALIPRQVSIFFGDNYVISFHDHKQDIFKPVRDRVQTAGSRLRTFGIDYLVYALVDLVVDRKFPLIEALSTHLEELEDEALERPTDDTLYHIHQARRALVTFHRLQWAERETVLALMRPDVPFIMPETRTYLRDCFDHAVAVLELVESYREMTNGLMEVYLMHVVQPHGRGDEDDGHHHRLLHAAQLPRRHLRHELRDPARQHARAGLEVRLCVLLGDGRRDRRHGLFIWLKRKRWI